MADQVSEYIVATAKAMGIDPSVALRVAKSEGLGSYIGDGGSSFGPFQLHYGGVNPAMPYPGLGDAFTKATGLDARNPSTVPQQVEFALGQAKKGGWGPWMGAAKIGVTGYTGIGPGRSPSGAGTTLSGYPASAVMPTAAAPSSPIYSPVAPTPPPPAIGQQIASGDYAGAAKQLTQRPPGQTKSPLEQLGTSLSSRQQQQQQPKAEPPPEAPPMLPIQDPTASMAPAAQQLFSQIVSAQTPLSWKRLPYGSGQAGPEASGTTLNSLKDFYG